MKTEQEQFGFPPVHITIYSQEELDILWAVLNCPMMVSLKFALSGRISIDTLGIESVHQAMFKSIDGIYRV